MTTSVTPAGAPALRPPPAWVAGLLAAWHRLECRLAVACFGFITLVLLSDVLLRELVAPAIRLAGFEPGALGIFASQKLSVFALVIGSFLGIGIATATGSHLAPKIAHSWVPRSWGPFMDRLADLVTGVFLTGVAWYGWVLVDSTRTIDLRAPVLDWPVWPIQLAIPLGFLSAAGRYFVYAVWPSAKPRPPAFQE